jgi:hypothetical protein
MNRRTAPKALFFFALLHKSLSTLYLIGFVEEYLLSKKSH